MLTIQARDGGSFQAYLALPPAGRGPGIVLMQEIFGINQVMRDAADRLAAHGFVVACPDLFWRQEPGIQLTGRTEEEWQRAFQFYQGLDEAKAVEDSAATLEALRAHPACTGKAGGAGFCLGGKLAYLLAARHDPDCCAGYYGVGIDKDLGEAESITTPLLLHIAGKDQYCDKEARGKIHAALDPHPHATLYDYPGQDHAFARPGGEHFDAEAAELAGLRTLAFFLKHLMAGSTDGWSPLYLERMWEDHIKYEFETRDTDDTIDTMVEDAYVNHIPVLTGGVGRKELHGFYSTYFIPKMPPDTTMIPISRTIGAERVVDEMIFQFTHTIEMPWMLPGIPPTGKRVEVPLIVVVHFRNGKLAHEHIYWDQACVLVQLGLLERGNLPVVGIESARKALDASLPANELIHKAAAAAGR
ncbi:MAG: dienelactone hydrolase family protein [Planctomycetota bacterium]